jgi:hypothetical protein
MAKLGKTNKLGPNRTATFLPEGIAFSDHNLIHHLERDDAATAWTFSSVPPQCAA